MPESGETIDGRAVLYLAGWKDHITQPAKPSR
jgi:hypothetical protein